MNNTPEAMSSSGIPAVSAAIIRAAEVEDCAGLSEMQSAKQNATVVHNSKS